MCKTINVIVVFPATWQHGNLLYGLKLSYSFGTLLYWSTDQYNNRDPVKLICCVLLLVNCYIKPLHCRSKSVLFNLSKCTFIPSNVGQGGNEDWIVFTITFWITDKCPLSVHKCPPYSILISKFLSFFWFSGSWHHFCILHCGVYCVILPEDPPGHASTRYSKHHCLDVFQHFCLVSWPVLHQS